MAAVRRGCLMPWWQYEPEKKYPFVPAEDPAEERVGYAAVLLVGGVLGFFGFILFAFLTRNWEMGNWGMAGSFAVAMLGHWLMPKDKPRRRP